MKGGVVAGGVILMVIGILLMATLGGVKWGASGGGAEAGGLIPFPLVGAGMAFIGFLVFIAGLAASPTPKQEGPVIVPLHHLEKEIVVCPSCGEKAFARSKFCPGCGRKLEIREKGKPGKGKFCIQCGAELPEDAKFCPECGRKV